MPIEGGKGVIISYSFKEDEVKGKRLFDAFDSY